MVNLFNHWKQMVLSIIVAIIGFSVFTSAEPLNDASKEGDLDKVRRLMEEGANIEARDASSSTPLYNAVGGSHRDIAKFLILKGTNVNANCTDGMTPFHRAVTLFGGDKALTELLIAKGAKVNAVDKAGYTPLWWAESGGFKEIMEILVKHGGHK
jgi:ankyrin repeat protein